MPAARTSTLPLVASRGILAALLIACLSGCSNHQRPTAAVIAVDRTGDSMEATSYRVTLAVNNDNLVSLPIEYIEYTLNVEGAGQYAGRWRPMQALYPNGESTVELPASVPGPVPAGSRAYSFAGRIFYESPRRFDRTLRDLGWWRPAASASGAGQTGG